MTQAENIFRISDTDKIVCPPDQVFQRTDFEFIFTPGGHLAKSEGEYLSLMTTLMDIGEKCFYLKENLERAAPDRKPFELTISTDSSLEYFNGQIYSFDESFGMEPFDWYVHGENQDWGIYVSEWPTILIIGCDKSLADSFRAVYNIKGNGYLDNREFLSSELNLSKDPDAIRTFQNNYKV